MAVNTTDAPIESMGAGRRWAIGANVTISIVIAFGLLVAVNWLASMKNVRRDIASIGNYGMSDRTKRILGDVSGDITISIVYAPNPQEKKQQEYINRVLDYCDELRAVSKNIKVEHVATAAQRSELSARIQGTFDAEAKAHRDVLASFEAVRTQLLAELNNLSTQCDALLGAESWLSDFPLFAQIVLKLREMDRKLNDAAAEIKNFVPEGGIPKYTEATNRAKTAAQDATNTMEAIARLIGELTRLADESVKPDSPHIQALRDVAAGVRAEIEALRQTIGRDGDAPPDDIKAALKAYADRAVPLGSVLNTLVARVDEFARQFPIVRQHANWTTRVQSGPMIMQLEVADVIEDMGRNLSDMRLQLLGIIDTGEPDKLSQALAATRQNTTRIEKNASVCERILLELSERLTNLDDPSRTLLESARGNALFAEQAKAVAQIEKQLGELPEFKPGAMADRINEDNSIVVAIGDKMRVIDFGEVWPVRESLSGADEGEQQRTFNGDSALASAILALKADKPFAAVTFVSFEPPAPPQRSPFMPPPPQSAVPSADLSEARARLEAANFKVYDWNLATDQERPFEVDEGLKDILILLPPAPPALPNPFAGQQPESPAFGEEHRRIIRSLIDKGSRALFVGTWEVTPGGFIGNRWISPPYGYETLLAEDWGLRLDNSIRVLTVEADVRTENGFFVNARKFGHLPLTGFTDHPVGKPMIGTRFLVVDCARIEKTAETPKGVTSEVVASIPKREDFLGGSIDDILQIVQRINDPKSEGLVQLGRPPMRDRFDVMVAAERAASENKAKNRIAVVAFGASIRDGYVKRPPLVDAERARFGPEPKESLDLLVNTMFWLNDTEGYIGRGPVPVPRVRSLSESQQLITRGIVWFAWPVLVVAPGIYLWFVRRR